MWWCARVDALLIRFTMVGASDLAKFLVFDKHYWNRGSFFPTREYLAVKLFLSLFSTHFKSLTINSFVDNGVQIVANRSDTR